MLNMTDSMCMCPLQNVPGFVKTHFPSGHNFGGELEMKLFNADQQQD